MKTVYNNTKKMHLKHQYEDFFPSCMLYINVTYLFNLLWNRYDSDQSFQSFPFLHKSSEMDE